MANTSNNMVSIINFVIGTEEDVSNQREMVLILEELFDWVIVSGSYGEGVILAASDIDFMKEQQGYIVYQLSDCGIESNRYIPFYMIPSPQNPVYCTLLCRDKQIVQEKFIECHEGNFYLSSSKIKYDLCNSTDGFVIHGPCVQRTYNNLEIEQAHCIRCFSWPEVANEWFLRPRPNGWPDTSLIKKIKEGPCHVVPVGLSESPTNSMEWRISFSLAERALVHSFNRTQFVVYCILKRITKEIIGKAVPNVMCSYFIKTVLFYSIESTPATIWRMQNLQECLYKCIRILFRFIDDKNCPHYFIRDVNLFKFKVNSQNQWRLLSVLRHLLDNNLTYILSRLKIFSEFVKLKYVQEKHIELTTDDRYKKLYGFFERSIPIDRKNEYNEDILATVTNFLCKSRTSTSNTVVHYSKMMFTLLADIICNTQSTSNRMQYDVDKIIERFYKVGTTFDVTSGRLRLATFYLMKGNVTGSLKVIQSVFDRFSPLVHVYYTRMTLSYFDRYKQIMCGKSLSTQQKFQSCVSLQSRYAIDNVNIPLAIRYQVWDNVVASNTEFSITEINPLTHAYFLQALCYIDLQDQDKLTNTVKMMKGMITDDTIASSYCRHNDYNLLAYILMKQGNIRDAVKYHVKSFYSKVEMQRTFVKDKYSIAVLRIMCCLRLHLQPMQEDERL